MRFSERYGYEKPSEVIIREKITLEIQNAICTCYDDLQKEINYSKLEEHIWCDFLNNRKNDFWIGGGYVITITEYINNKIIGIGV